MPSYSISGPTSGPITVPRNVLWETPEWSWAFWLKCPDGLFLPGTFSTNLSNLVVPGGVETQLYSSGLYCDLNGTQVPVGTASGDIWQHYAFCFDATDFRTYWNGALGNTTALGAMTWGTGDLTIAAFDNTAARLFGMRIYDRKLDASEVATLAGGGVVTPGLVAHWPLGEGTFDTITDTVSGLVGTAAGGINWSVDVPTPGGGPSSSLRPGFRSPFLRSPMIKGAERWP